MQDMLNNLQNLANNQAQTNAEPVANGPRIIKTDAGAKDGQTKCPKCGATEISLNPNNGKLRCEFCRHEFEPEKSEDFATDISSLHGEVMGSGATDIEADVNSMITMKCSSCGAEVVIDTNETTNARCHWCRNVLSINEQIPNGSVPDVVLPFSIKKDEAKAEIEKFVGKRKFFAHPKFKKEFTTDNVMGVYLPYMVVDVNGHSDLVGQGEHLVRRYTVGSGDNKKTYYDADLYNVERHFDITIEGLTVESSADKLDNNSSDKTNNIINSIMPFDIENAVRWDSNYLRGYSSEKRDVNISQLKPLVEEQSKDIARIAANETLNHYDRGVRWDRENLDVKGQQWRSAYLPVWLYGYQQEKKNGKKILHYAAVNARTKETMGSVPIHMPKLLIVSALVELLSFGGTLLVEFDSEFLLLTIGFIYFFLMLARYRNKGARHTYENETKRSMFNMSVIDELVEHKKRLSNSTMSGANNTTVRGMSKGAVFEDAVKKAVDKKMTGITDKFNK